MSGFQFKSVFNPGSTGFEFTNDSMTFWDMSCRHGGVPHCLKLTSAVPARRLSAAVSPCV